MLHVPGIESVGTAGVKEDAADAGHPLHAV
jgi:hypothetical protein